MVPKILFHIVYVHFLADICCICHLLNLRCLFVCSSSDITRGGQGTESNDDGSDATSACSNNCTR